MCTYSLISTSLRIHVYLDSAVLRTGDRLVELHYPIILEIPQI